MRPIEVLIADDNRELAENLRDILLSSEEIRTNCRIAGTGHEALAYCRERGSELDIVLLDLRLPDVFGLELLADLKSACPFAETIIVTGNASVESAAAAVQERAFAYVLKPFRAPELLRTVKKAADQVLLFREREELQKRLEQSERRHREMVENMPAYVVALDANDRIALWNRELARVTGYAAHEMLGQPGADLVGSGGERRLPLKRGGHRMVRWKRTRSDPASEQSLSYALGVDITEEQDMLRRTLRAERLATAGTLAAGLAHEVRNPLNSATLQLQLLRRRAEKGALIPEGVGQVTDVILSEVQRLERLVTDFLAFARPAPLKLQPVSLNDLVRGVLRLFEPEAAAAGVTCSLELDTSIGQVELEEERLRQVLLNLMRNAVEAMVPKGGVLTLRTAPPDQDGFISLSVEDTGPGFPEDARVFDAFYTTKPGGTGLGLAIVHRIVTEHGGTVRVKSRPGSTVFTLRFPESTPARVSERPPAAQ